MGDPTAVTAEEVRATVEAERAQPPLVHCITATVSMGIVADGLLAAGARPMMTVTLDEAPVVTTAAEALLVNLGTLSTDAATGIPATVEASRAAGRPWVLDPAAVGLAPVRTALARALLEQAPSVVRANASEVLVLAGAGTGGRGADSAADPDDAAAAAAHVAGRTGGVVAVSGPVDLVTDGTLVHRVAGGSPLLTRVTGTGCLLGALTAACAARATPMVAAVAATAWMAAAGGVAATAAPRPGSFRVALLDALDTLTPDDVAHAAEVAGRGRPDPGWR